MRSPRANLATPSAGKFFYSGNELEALAGATNYYDAIVRHFDGMLRGRVVEVGAGIGTSAEHILRRGRPSEGVTSPAISYAAEAGTQEEGGAGALHTEHQSAPPA